ncbi:MAG: hypothetical protein JNN07_10830 [Verrucomicrobiales bacterium]|nr:hypothetical protein [Verrucomicrobiales bacterium]
MSCVFGKHGNSLEVIEELITVAKELDAATKRGKEPRPDRRRIGLLWGDGITPSRVPLNREMTGDLCCDAPANL